jgi:hypothetical protein
VFNSWHVIVSRECSTNDVILVTAACVGLRKQDWVQNVYMTFSHLVGMSWFESPLGLVTRYYFQSEGCCLKVVTLFLWGALSDTRRIGCVTLLSWFDVVTDGHRPILLGVGHPFGTHDQILLFNFFWRTISLLSVLGRPLWREDGSVICSAICQWPESRRTRNRTLLSHLRLLRSLSVASYDSQGLRWKYSTLSDERTGL